MVKGVEYFKPEHNLLPSNEKNNKCYTDDQQYEEYTTFHDNDNCTTEVLPDNVLLKADECVADYQHGKMDEE